MKCPNCGAEVREEDKFCGECGKPLRREIEFAPVWKWGSMIASLVLVFISWMDCINRTTAGVAGIYALQYLMMFGLPATIYLMYKERTKKIKYGLAWISFPILTWFYAFPILTWLLGMPYMCWSEMTSDLYDCTVITFLEFTFLVITAIVIDVIYVYKTS